MTYEQMKRVVKLQWKEVLKTRDAGQKEYARTEDNVFANFERVAKKLSNPANRTDIPSDDPVFSRITRENVLLVYLLKHIDGICAHVDGHTSQRDRKRKWIRCPQGLHHRHVHDISGRQRIG